MIIRKNKLPREPGWHSNFIFLETWVQIEVCYLSGIGTSVKCKFLDSVYEKKYKGNWVKANCLGYERDQI